MWTKPLLLGPLLVRSTHVTLRSVPCNFSVAGKRAWFSSTENFEKSSRALSKPPRAVIRKKPQAPSPSPPTPSAEPRVPRSKRREIKLKFIEEAADRGDRTLPTRSKRDRLLAEQRLLSEEKQREQKKEYKLSESKEATHQDSNEKLATQDQQIYNLTRKIQQALLANDISECTNLYSSLKKLTTPNEETIRQMVAGYCRNGLVLEAVKIFEEYKQIRPQVTNNLYGAVLLAVGMAGDLERAREYFEEAKRVNKVEVTDSDVWLVARMVKVCAKHKQLDEVLRLLEEVNVAGFPQNSLFCATVIEALGKCGADGLALSLLSDLKKKKFPVDIHVYNALLEVLADSGADELADAIFLEMPLMGVRPDSASYAAVIRALGAKIQRTMQVFEQAQTNLCLSPAVHDAMILAYLTAQRVGDAVRLHETMKPRYAASIHVLEVLLEAANKTQNAKLREKLLEEIRKRGLRQDIPELERSRMQLKLLDQMKQREVKIIFPR